VTKKGSGFTKKGSGFGVQSSGLAFCRPGPIAVSLLIVCLMAACGGPRKPEGGPDEASRRGPSPAASDPGPERTAASPCPAAAHRMGREEEPERPAARSPTRSGLEGEEEAEEEEASSDEWPEPQRVRSLADLLEVPDAASRWVPNLPRMEVDEARAAALGIRKLTGKRLTLFTDLASDEEIDALPQVFDQAFPQWCEYFSIDPSDHPEWNVTGFLIGDQEAFQQAGLMPESLPPFEHGFSWNYDLWLYEQPSAYYRRHLLLHEGTHSFMNTILRGCGPPWYMEGMAELLGTHLWQEGRLTLNYMPARREDVPMWGRIKIIKDDYAANRAKSFQGVLDYSPRAHLRTEPYAWCWAAAAFLDGDPRYRERFRQLSRLVLEADFNARFRRLMGDDWDALAEQWQVFVADIEYGYDVARAAVDLTPGQPLAEAGASIRVEAARGWQNSGLRVEGGVTYRLRASGRYQVAQQPQIWWCEPGGVSIRYYKGRPLGMLLAAVCASPARPEEPSGLLRPSAVGLGATLKPTQSGTLFLRINDSGAELADNAGTLTVHVKAAGGQ